MNKLTLHKKVLISLLLAFTVGLMANSQQEAKQTASLIYWLLECCDFVGKLFLNALKMVVIPLVLTSVICGVSQIAGERDFGRLGLKTLLLYSLTGILAVATGLFCVNLLQPGDVALRSRRLSSPVSFHQPRFIRKCTGYGGEWMGKPPPNFSPDGTSKFILCRG